MTATAAPDTPQGAPPQPPAPSKPFRPKLSPLTWLLVATVVLSVAFVWGRGLSRSDDRAVLVSKSQLKAFSALKPDDVQLEIRQVDSSLVSAKIPAGPAIVLRSVAPGQIVTDLDLLPLASISLPQDAVAVDVAVPHIGVVSTVTVGQEFRLLFGDASRPPVIGVALSRRQADGSVIVAVSEKDAASLAPALVKGDVVLARPIGHE